ncbi:MAG: hypothetical protein ACP5IL_06350, partial [Syntrophobacteraceae bacterium]
VDIEKIKREFADSALVEREKERRIEDKVVALIENQAVIVATVEETLEPQGIREAVEEAGARDEQA